MSSEKLTMQRKKNLDRFRRYNIKQKAKKNDNAAKDPNPSTSGNISTCSQKEKKLIVKLPLPVICGTKFKKYKLALRALTRKIGFMTEKLRKQEKLKRTLQKRNGCVSRRLSRLPSESGGLQMYLHVLFLVNRLILK